MALEKTKPTEKNQYTKLNNGPLKRILYQASLLHEGQTENTMQRQRAASSTQKHVYLTIYELDETLLTLI